MTNSADRPLAHVSRGPRLPVWPVGNGILSWATALVGLKGVSKALERRWGGRVQPMQLPVAASDPFLMLVHHRHSFSACDPVRPFSALVMPEGFPAHPHRGFQTVTFVLEGGMQHRDSVGVKMTYRAGSVQWLKAGRAVMHEEMWAHEPGRRATGVHELYQVWVNLPHKHKMDAPEIQLIGDGTVEIGSIARAVPLTSGVIDGVQVTVVSGACRGLRSEVQTATPVTILRLEWPAPAAFVWDELPAEHTALCFVRAGSVRVGDHVVSAGELAHFDRQSDARRLRITALEPGTDVLLLTGEPIREPVAMGGSMVMTTRAEVEQAYRDVSSGVFGPSWSHRDGDEDWLRVIGGK